MNRTTPPAGAPPRTRWSRTEWRCLAFACLITVLLALAPHAAALARYGTWEYVSDGDDSTYLAITRIPYSGESPRDPFAGKWEALPGEYPSIPFVPTGVFNRALGLPLLAVSVEWRALGGLLLGASLFVLFRTLLAGTRRPAAWALGCSLICIGDAGFVQGRSFIENWLLLPYLLRGVTPLTKPDGIPQFRIPSPILMLPFLLIMAAAFLPAARGSRKWAAAGALAFGMCVLEYFYFWTAAIAGVACYLSATWIWTWLRRSGPFAARFAPPLVVTRLAAVVMVGGVIIGAPELYRESRITAQPQYRALLPRLCRGQSIPPGDPYRRMNLFNLWTIGKLALGGAAILALDLPGLAIFWWLGFAGYVLANSALATGMEFENWHWQYVQAPMSEIVILGAAAMLLDRGGRIPGKLLAAAPVSIVLIAAIWRPYEALTAPEAVHNSRTLAELRAFRPALKNLSPYHLLAGPPEADLALLFTNAGRLYHAYTAKLSLISDDDANQRHAWNEWLQGEDWNAYLERAANDSVTLCDLALPAWRPEAVLAARTSFYLRFRDQSLERDLLARYRADYLLARTGVAPNPKAGPWVARQSSDQWTLWVRQGVE